MTILESSLLNHLTEFIAFARGRLRDPDLAADVVQESLLKALQRGHQLRDDESVRAWFYRILRHTIIDLERRRQTRERATERLTVESDVAAEPEAERVACRCLEHLLPSLKPEYSVLIQRHDLGGDAIEKLTVDLDISRNNLTVRLHRARKQLRERLEAACRACATHGCLDCTCEPPAGTEGGCHD